MENPSGVFIAADHAGVHLKEAVIEKLKTMNIAVEDLGPNSVDRVDYPDFADKVCQSICDDNHFGVLICGSGQGMAMRANKYSHIRAALCWNEESAVLARGHNNANVLCVGARMLDEKLVMNIVESFFTTPFEGGRHQGRVEKISLPASL
ncbi:MAG: ribose 5-phosphate isomerase B [Bdellovibrionales bacterium]|nr:ribose 5-phosphate isomerase B [Bdellovibrionales bacterium]